MNETIFIKKIKHENFTTVDNGFVRNTALSWKAKGILLYLISLPENWVLNLNELKNHATDGISSLRAGINELKENGYVRVSSVKDEKGKFTGTKYEVDEYGMLPELENLISDNPISEKPISENRTLLNTNNNQILNKLNTNTTNTPSPSEIELQKKLDEANKKIEEQEQTLSKFNKKTKKSDTTTLCEPDFYTSLLNAYKKVFFSVRKSGVPCTKDYKKYVDKALLRLRELGLSDNEAHDRMLEAINNAPTLDYWVNEAKCAFAYIVSDYGLSKLCGSSQNLKKGGGSVVAQKGNGEFDELGIPF